MVVTDTIGDMFGRINFAIQSKYENVVVPFSNLRIDIVKIMKDDGFIEDYKIVNEERLNRPSYSVIEIILKYDANKKSVINGLRRISKPGLRVYVKPSEIPTVVNGIAILSTSKSVMSDKEARDNSLGGEVLAYVW